MTVHPRAEPTVTKRRFQNNTGGVSALVNPSTTHTHKHHLKASLAARRARSAATQLAVKNHMKSPEIATRRYLIRA